MTEDERTNEIALAEYKEVVAQFRTLTDIRFKLLTYLPLGTVAAAVFVSPTNDLMKQPAISAFAFVVTLCIATYNKRNDQFYDELVSRAAELERKLQVEHGSFSDRPTRWLKYGFVPIEHRWPIGLVYAASASLWAYLFTAAAINGRSGLRWVDFAAPAAVIACWQGFRRMERARSETLKEVIKELMTKLVKLKNDPPQDKLAEELTKTMAASPILNVKSKTAARRLAYHWKGYEQEPNSRTASALLSAVTDLPARWIEDVFSGRR